MEEKKQYAKAINKGNIIFVSFEKDFFLVNTNEGT